MRLIKMVRVYTILNFFTITMLVSPLFAQSNSPVRNESNSLLKLAGPPQILICRPVYAPYSQESNTMYISAITEAYFHFKLNGLPGYQVISQERVADNIQHFRDFSRRISRSAYVDAAKQLGASYLFYVEYEPQGKTVKFNIEFYSIIANKKLLTSLQEISLSKFEDGLFNCLNEVTSSLPESFSGNVHQFLGSPILGTNDRPVEALGNLITSMGGYSQKRAEEVAEEYEKIVSQNRDMHLGKMVAASVLAHAQQYNKAIMLQENLLSSFGKTYPALYLQLARYYRLAEQFSDALNAVSQAQKVKELELLARTEKARIYEAMGDLNAANKEYQNVLSLGGEDGEIFFQLALVSIGLNDLPASSSYLTKAESAGRTIDRSDYYDLGLRYKKLGSADDKAIDAFKKSLGIQQDKEEAWLQLAEIYSKSGKELDAAECYVNLFHINNNAYKEHLIKAGIKFEALGKTNRAKEAYSLYIARRFKDPEVSLRLAKIELADGNCEKATELVREMDTSMVYGAEAKKINQQCGVKERRIVVNTDIGRQKGNAAIFMWRVLSGIVTGGGIGAGLFLNSKIDEKIDDYTTFEEEWRASMHLPKTPENIKEERDIIDELHSDIESYKLYRTVSYGVAGVGAASFALSITLPIISRK